MARILLVDDSVSARALLGVRLTAEGFSVVECSSAAEAASLALGSPPDAVVTDLWMPGVSGLMLCRLLRAEPATAHVPVVLLTASDDRRSRFWARNAGATAYVMKTEIDRLVQLLSDVTSSPKTRPPPSLVPSSSPTVTRGTVQERLAQLLDENLFASTIAGEVRALSQRAEELEQIFDGLAALASDVASYRWLALSVTPESGGASRACPRLFIHTHPDLRDVEREARDALDVPPPPERRRGDDSGAVIVSDLRATAAEWTTPPLVQAVTFGATTLAQVGLGPARRGVSHDDRRLVSLLANELGGPLRMAALVAEATRLASTDTLTGLLNRRAFIERIDRARAADPERSLFPVSALLLDVDHFKKVNDTLGHDAGDAVLQGVARVLSGMARKTDFVARWGGEEFVLFLSNTAEAGARIAAERLRRALAETRYPLPNGTEHRATASIGLACAESSSWHLDELLGRADKAMYSAKHRGRNRVETA